MTVLNIYLVLILLSPSCPATAIAYKVAKIVAIRQHDQRVLGIFSLRIRKNDYL